MFADRLFISNFNRQIVTFDEYSRQGLYGRNKKPPNHGGPYKLPIYDNADSISNNALDNTLIMPCSAFSTSGLWHAFHHLFICYSAVKDIEIDNVIIYLFTSPDDRKKEKKIRQHYNPDFLELMYHCIKTKKTLEEFTNDYKSNYRSIVNKDNFLVNNLYIYQAQVDFARHEQLRGHLRDFTANLIDKYKIVKEDKHILIVCRRRRTENPSVRNREFSNQRDIEIWSGENTKASGKLVKCVYLEDHSFREQISLFYNASTVIGAHGSGLVWCAFMEANAKLVELFPRGIGATHAQSDDYSFWCHMAGVEYHVDFCDFEGDVHEHRKCSLVMGKAQLHGLFNH